MLWDTLLHSLSSRLSKSTFELRDESWDRTLALTVDGFVTLNKSLSVFLINVQHKEYNLYQSNTQIRDNIFRRKEKSSHLGQ